MAKSMEDRTPLTNYWTAIRSKNPAVAGFKPDINGPIKTYDAALLNYTKFMSDRDNLKPLLTTYMKQCNSFADKMDQQRAELAKLIEQHVAKSTPLLDKIMTVVNDEDVDPVKIAPQLDNLVNEDQDMVNSRKAIWDQLSRLNEQALQSTKKLRDDYKAKATAISNGMKKAEDDVTKLEPQIRSIIAAYQKLATPKNDNDLVDAVRSLLDRF